MNMMNRWIQDDFGVTTLSLDQPVIDWVDSGLGRLIDVFSC
jgi:hypothetical protein